MLPDTVYKMPVYICLRNLGLNFCCLGALWVRVNIILHDSHLFVYPGTNVVGIVRSPFFMGYDSFPLNNPFVTISRFSNIRSGHNFAYVVYAWPLRRIPPRTKTFSELFLIRCILKPFILVHSLLSRRPLKTGLCNYLLQGQG